MSAAVQARSPLPTVHHVRLAMLYRQARMARVLCVATVWSRTRRGQLASHAMSGLPARADSVISAARVRSLVPTVRRASRVQ